MYALKTKDPYGRPHPRMRVEGAFLLQGHAGPQALVFIREPVYGEVCAAEVATLPDGSRALSDMGIDSRTVNEFRAAKPGDEFKVFGSWQADHAIRLPLMQLTPWLTVEYSYTLEAALRVANRETDPQEKDSFYDHLRAWVWTSHSEDREVVRHDYGFVIKRFLGASVKVGETTSWVMADVGRGRRTRGVGFTTGDYDGNDGVPDHWKIHDRRVFGRQLITINTDENAVPRNKRAMALITEADGSVIETEVF